MYSNIDALEESYNRRKALQDLQNKNKAELDEQIMMAQAYEELIKEKEKIDGGIKG